MHNSRRRQRARVIFGLENIAYSAHWTRIASKRGGVGIFYTSGRIDDDSLNEHMDWESLLLWWSVGKMQ
jgi:hypothetical protein